MLAIAYAVMVGSFRFAGYELRHPREQYYWLLRTALRIASTTLVDVTLAFAVGQSVPRPVIWILRAIVAMIACTLTYAHNVAGIKPSDGMPSSSRLGAVLVTGATAGIGKATAYELSRRGFKVIIPARSKTKAASVAAMIGSGVFAVDAPLELSDQASVRAYAHRVRNALAKMSIPLTTIVLNAGIMQPNPVKSVDGAELTIASNQLGHHTLVMQLLPELQASASLGYDCRVVVVSSSLHRHAARQLLRTGATSSFTDLSPPNRREDFAMFRVRFVHSNPQYALFFFKREGVRPLQTSECALGASCLTLLCRKR